MRLYVAAVLLLLVGCESIDRLTVGKQSSNDSYDTSPPPIEYVRPEPYATLAGTHPNDDGTISNIYLVHWKGNDLNHKTFLEEEIDILKIPKYKD